VRVIAATNVNPLEAVKKGKLREDLYYRLNVFAIELPPLRQRKEDLPLLIQSFLGEFNARNNKNVSAVDPAPCASWSSTTGRATCASCATSSSGR
jgi:transcriptional regulator with PAS, ATPase and Fis domain